MASIVWLIVTWIHENRIREAFNLVTQLEKVLVNLPLNDVGGGFTNALGQARSVGLVVLVAFIALMFVVGSFKYGSGSEDGARGGKKNWIRAGIALLIGLAATAITGWLQSIGGSSF